MAQTGTIADAGAGPSIIQVNPECGHHRHESRWEVAFHQEVAARNRDGQAALLANQATMTSLLTQVLVKLAATTGSTSSTPAVPPGP